MLRIERVVEPVSYADAWKLQQGYVEALIEGSGEEVLILLEHEPVYTIGRLRDRSSLRDVSRLPHPVVETNRGGKATYHGPGQLVGYPILDLNRRGRDLHAHLRMIEESLIAACRAYHLEATRRDGLTGVWVGEKKLAAIGVGVRRWVTMHGFAINVKAVSLAGFSAITPCGLEGVAVTSLESEIGQPLALDDVARVIGNEFSCSLAESD